MKVLSFLLIFLIRFASAQEVNSLLWEINGPALDKPSYLYGTMHLQDSRAFQFADSVMPKFNSCEAVALELVQDLESTLGALDAMMLPNGDSLKNYMKPKDYAQLKEFVDANMGLLGAIVDVIKPVFVSVFISESFAENNVAMALDMFLQQKATDSEKILIGLESLQEQMAALDVIKMKYQVRMIMDQLEDMDAAGKMMEDLITAYQEQDLSKVSVLMRDANMPRYVYKALIVDRNRVMAHRIDSIIRLHSTFIAVGAGHLPNKDGLISLLTTMGYSVEPIISQYTPSKSEELLYDNWEQFNSKFAPFKIEMPATPIVNVDTIETENGRVEYHMWMYEDKKNGVFFSVSSMLVPAEQIKTDGDSYYENTVDRMAQNTGGNVIRSKRLHLKGLEGIEAEYQAIPGMNFRVRIFLTGQRTHIIMIGGPPAKLYGASADRFLNSFELIR